MSTTTSLERSSFVADFELIAGSQSFRPAQVAPDYIIMKKQEPVPAGPAELIIRIEGKEERRRRIEIIGPVEGDPLRIEIRR